MSDEVHDYIRYWRERAIKAEDENARLKERIDQLEKNVTAFAGQLESWGFDAAAKQIRSEIGVDVEAPNFYKLQAENARLKAENERLSQLLHDEMSQLEIATDLGNKRWTALNKIYEHGEKHNANWCKRMAQEGLGIKNA